MTNYEKLKKDGEFKNLNFDYAAQTICPEMRDHSYLDCELFIYQENCNECARKWLEAEYKGEEIDVK